MPSYKFNLANARANTGIRNVIGKCSSSSEFATILNDVTETLMRRGSWWETEVVVKLCVTSCQIVWPKYVGTVKGIRFCCFGNVDVKNNWYAIEGPRTSTGNSIGGVSGTGTNGYNGIGYGGWTAPTSFDGTTTPVHTQITGNTGKFIRYSVVKNTDYGKTIRIHGTQYGGQPLQELVDGAWVDGITLTAASPFAQSTVLVTRIDHVVREATEGMTYLYQYDPTTTDQLQLAVYDPNDTNPQWRKSIVQQFGQIRNGEDANGQKIWTLEAMCKLQYFPVVNDRDFLFIGNMRALAYGVQALRLDEAGDPENAENFWAKAIRELNFESRDKNPAEAFVVKARMMGSCRIVSNPI